jgi:hypothetical protein
MDHGVDSYENLILLCRDDHKVVDDQPSEFPVQRLREMKKDHEVWAEGRFGSEIAPVRLRAGPESKKVRLARVKSGTELWHLLSGVQAYRLMPPDSSEANDEQCDAADNFLDSVKDWGEISSDISDRGPSRIREATRALDSELEDIAAQELVAFAGLRQLTLEGGVGPPTAWWELWVKVSSTKSETRQESKPTY